MRKSIFLLLVAAMLIVPVLGASAQDAGQVYVYGDVRDAAYEADGIFPGVQGAIVTVTAANGDVAGTSETVNAEGSFGVSAKLRKGTYTVSVELPGSCSLVSIEVDGREVVAGGESAIDIVIDANVWAAGTFGPILVRVIDEEIIPPDDPCANLPSEVTVFGRVEDLSQPLDASKWPEYAGIEGAEIKLEYYWEYQSEDGNIYTGWTEVPFYSPKLTGDRGYFAFTDVTRGCKYRLTVVSAAGYQLPAAPVEFWTIEAESSSPFIFQLEPLV